jgi:hypothetical protein
VRTVTGSTVRVDLSRAPRGERRRRADGRPGARPGPLALVVVAAFALITFLKGKTMLGVVAMFVPVVGVVAAIGLAKPTSPWARWRSQGLRDAIGSAPSAR